MASRAAARFDIRAVDKSLSTIRNINKNINGMLKPVRNLRNGLKALSRESGLANLGRGVRAVGGEIGRLAGIASAAGAAGFFALNKMTQHADEVIKAATNYGIATDAVQEWRFVAERSGVSVATINKSMQAFTKRLAEAKNGSGELHGLLSKVNPEFLKQLVAIEDNTEAYDFMIKSMAKLPDQQRQILLGDKAFSEAGRELVKITAMSAKEIKGLKQESRDYGHVLNREVLEQSAAFQDEMTNMGSIVKSVAFAVGAEMIPEVKNLLIQLREWFMLNKDVIKPKVAAFAKQAAAGIKEFAVWVKNVVPPVIRFIQNIGGLKTVAIGLAAIMAGPLISAVVALGLALSASPIGLFVTAVGVLVALGSKLYDSWTPFRNLIDGLNDMINTLIKGFVAASKLVGNFVVNPLSVFSGANKKDKPIASRASRRRLRSPVAQTAAPLAQGAQSQANVNGNIKVQIESALPVKVKKIESNQSDLALDVDSGRSMAAL